MSVLQQKIIAETEANPHLKSNQIGARLGCHPAYVRTAWARAGLPKRREGHEGRRAIPRPLLHFKVSKECFDWLAAEAGKANVSVDEYAAAIFVDAMEVVMAEAAE